MASPKTLAIRPAQLQALGAAKLEMYVDRLAVHIAEVFPGHAQFIRSKHGRQFMFRCVKQARGYGLADEHSMTLYTDLAVALGEDFCERPQHEWIREILDERGHGATGKMFLIYKDLPTRCPQPPLPPPKDPPVPVTEVTAEPEPKVMRSAAFWWGDEPSAQVDSGDIGNMIAQSARSYP